MNNLIGERVEVISTETVYRGKLIEVNEQEVHIQGDSGWLIIPLEKILEIRAAH